MSYMTCSAADTACQIPPTFESRKASRAQAGATELMLLRQNLHSNASGNSRTASGAVLAPHFEEGSGEGHRSPKRGWSLEKFCQTYGQICSF